MVPDPIGPMNLANVDDVTRSTPTIICGWGQDPAVTTRGHGERVINDLRALSRTLSALKINADGSPAHPLYLSGDLKPIPFTA
jgi:hypothetical protein